MCRLFKSQIIFGISISCLFGFDGVFMGKHPTEIYIILGITMQKYLRAWRRDRFRNCGTYERDDKIKILTKNIPYPYCNT